LEKQIKNQNYGGFLCFYAVMFEGYGHRLQFRAITFVVQGFMVVAISGMVISAPLNHRISAHSSDLCSFTGFLLIYQEVSLNHLISAQLPDFGLFNRRLHAITGFPLNHLPAPPNHP
jgi:hypothetical protein